MMFSILLPGNLHTIIGLSAPSGVLVTVVSSEACDAMPRTSFQRPVMNSELQRVAKFLKGVIIRNVLLKLPVKYEVFVLAKSAA